MRVVVFGCFEYEQMGNSYYAITSIIVFFDKNRNTDCKK